MPTLNDLPDADTIVALARKRRLSLFLVGGYLRDQYLGRSGRDLDLVVSANAIAFARAFAKKVHGAFILLDEEIRLD